MTRLRAVRTVIAFDLSSAWRSARAILFLVIYGLVSAWFLSLLLRQRAAIEGIVLAPDNARALALTVLSWFMSEEGQLSRLLAEHPPLLVFYAHYAVALVPVFTMLGAFDQTASDLASRHVRFMLPKTTRAAVYWGRLVGAYLWVVGPAVLLTLGFGITCGDTLYGFRLAFTLAVYSLSFVALMAFLAAATGQPGLSLSIGAAWQFLVWLASTFLSFADERSQVVDWLFPSVVKPWLLAPGFWVWLGGLGVSLLYSALLVGAGYLVFARRDV